jgi:hypothetical protein
MDLDVPHGPPACRRLPSSVELRIPRIHPLKNIFTYMCVRPLVASQPAFASDQSGDVPLGSRGVRRLNM